MPEDDDELVITNQAVSKVDGGPDQSKSIDLTEDQKRDGGLVGSGGPPGDADSETDDKR